MSECLCGCHKEGYGKDLVVKDSCPPFLFWHFRACRTVSGLLFEEASLLVSEIDVKEIKPMNQEMSNLLCVRCAEFPSCDVVERFLLCWGVAFVLWMGRVNPALHWVPHERSCLHCVQ